MKSYIFYLLIFVIIQTFSFAQISQTAIVCDPQTDSENGKKFFNSIVDNLNNKTDIQLVAVIGNLTYSGSYDELRSLESLSISEFAAEEKIDSLQTISIFPGTIINELADYKLATLSPVISSNQKIYSATVNGRIFCLDDRGKQLWEYNTYGKIYNSIIKDRDLIIAITQGGDIHTINANTGDLFQVIGIGDIVTSDFNLIDISYSDMKTKGIVFGTASGDVYCYELYSLEMVWSNNISEFNITSSPMNSNNKIIFQDSDENYYCINAGNGILVWKWKADVKSGNRLFRSSMNYNNNSVFVTDSDGDVHSIDILLGAENWIKKKAAASGKIFYSKLSLSLFVHTNKNKIVVLKESNGRILSEVKLSKELQNTLPSAWLETDSGLIIGFDNGLISLIDTKKNFSELLFTDNAPIISITKTGEKEYVTNNLDGKITKFTLP